MKRIEDGVDSLIGTHTKFSRYGNFPKVFKQKLSVYAEVEVVKIVWLHEGLKCWLRRVRVLQDYLWVLYKPCSKSYEVT